MEKCKLIHDTVDMADQYPMAEVIGTDLSPIQPSWVPANWCVIFPNYPSIHGANSVMFLVVSKWMMPCWTGLSEMYGSHNLHISVLPKLIVCIRTSLTSFISETPAPVSQTGIISLPKCTGRLSS